MGLFDKYTDLVGGKKEVNQQAAAKPIKKNEFKIAKKEEQPRKEPAAAKKDDSPKKNRSFNPFLWLIKLGVMIKKDLRLLIRSKASALIVLLGPLAIILLVGLAFNSSSLYNIRIATYSEGYSELSNSIISSLQDQQYSIVKANSLELCQKGIKFGDYHLCVIFPKDLQIGNDDNTIQIYVDQSRTNLASVISNAISEKVAAKSTELGIGITQDMLTVLDNTKKAIEGKIEIVNKLISDNSDSSLKVQGAEDELSRIDLDSSSVTFNFTDVDARIKAITDRYNLSLVLINNLKDSVADVKMNVNALNAKLSEAGSARGKTVQDLKDIRKVLTTSLTDLNMLRDSLKVITTNVGSIKITQAGLIVEPIKTKVEPITKEDKHLSFLFPTMVVLVIMFISILFSSIIVVREKLSSAYFRNFITPTSDLLYMAGTYLTNIIIVMLQLGILFVAALYFFKDQLTSVALSLAIVIIIIASVFILIGMVIGYLFKTEETSTLAAISVSSIMLLFSNTILPVESLPNLFRDVVRYNPFVISEGILKKILLFGTDIKLVLDPIYILLSIFAILFIIGYIAREMTKRSI